jgi:hypothetical protein
MNRILITSLITAFLFGSAFMLIQSEKSNKKIVDQPTNIVEWALNATAIEACTCPMFCQCYFNTEPAAHSHDHGEEAHYCKFNMAWKVDEGHYGETDLTGAIYWIAGDLGGGWEDGVMDWAALHFDPSVSSEQREGIALILGNLFPVEWNSFVVGEDKQITWRASQQESVALLDDGNAAEVRLVHPPTAMTDEPAVLTNIHYWGAPRHNGFVLMPNQVQAYRTGDQPFESSDTNGFMITVDINSDDI